MKAIGHVRVSTDQQAERGVSLEAQVEKIRAMAVVHGTELAETRSSRAPGPQTRCRAPILRRPSRDPVSSQTCLSVGTSPMPIASLAAKCEIREGDAPVNVRVQDRDLPHISGAIPSVLQIGPPAPREDAVLALVDNLVFDGGIHTPRFIARVATNLKGNSRQRYRPSMPNRWGNVPWPQRPDTTLL